MPSMKVVLNVERDGFDAMRGLSDPGDPRLLHLSNAPLELGALTDGMQSGNPSIAFCFPLPDGKVVLAESSLALLLTAADALRVAYGDPRW